MNKHIVTELIIALIAAVVTWIFWPSPVAALIMGVPMGMALAFAFIMHDLRHTVLINTQQNR